VPVCNAYGTGLDHSTFAMGRVLMRIRVVGVVVEELAIGDEGLVFVGGVDAVAGEDEAVDHVGGLFDEEEERGPRKGLG